MENILVEEHSEIAVREDTINVFDNTLVGFIAMETLDGRLTTELEQLC